MSADKQKLEQTIDKIDELLAVLKDIAEDLKKTSDSLKSIAVGQITSKPSIPTANPRTSVSSPMPRAPAAPAPVPNTLKAQSIEDIRMMFPEELDSMLVFEDKGEYVMIKPKQFLGSENFAKIASTVRGIGGEYISAGRDSHFRVYKTKN
ncbi:MAG TPA: hypothetical protein VMD05_06780 [Candidatus Nanoarchaeia archaeon]|nr:hypothetical protein [Candidatus Nanoarchaeia archaeon]